jgi:hypothetical protein
MKELVYPSGSYPISDTMVLENISVSCSPFAIFKPTSPTVNMFDIRPNTFWNGGMIDCSGINFSATVFTIDGKYQPGMGATRQAPCLENIYFNTRRSTLGGGTAILFTSNGESNNAINFCRLDGLRFYGFSDAIKMYLDKAGWITANLFSNIAIHSCVRGINLYSEPTAIKGCNGNLFSNIQLQPSPISIDGIKITKGSYNRFDNLMMWDADHLTGFHVNIVSGTKNIFHGYIDRDSIHDGGRESVFGG